MGNLWQKLAELLDNEQPTSKVASEIKAIIFVLLSIFGLVSLTSYFPQDYSYIKSGQTLLIENLSGYVGALYAEFFLGFLGIVGYSSVIFTAYLAYLSFKGVSLLDISSKIFGGILLNIFSSILCFVAFHQTYLQVDSLMLGGKVGQEVGTFLVSYFNTLGSLLIIAAGYVVTISLAGFSINEHLKLLFSEEGEELTPKKEEAKKTPTPDEETLQRRQRAKQNVLSTFKKPEKSPPKKSKKVATTTDPSVLADGETIDLEEGDTENEEAKELDLVPEILPYKNAYKYPTLGSLNPAPRGAKATSGSERRKNSRALCEHLLSFNITGNVTAVSEGPFLTTYEYKPSAGIKLSSIANLQNDLGVVLGTNQLRIVAPIPGKTVVGIEIPRTTPQVIALKELLSHKQFQDSKLKLPIAIGKTTDGQNVFGDLTAMPHLLVAGATGSGKSVFVNSLITSLIYRLPPQKLRMVLIDPKMLELVIFQGIPHLVSDVITNSSLAHNALLWAVNEMESRYQMMAETGSKNIESYNEKMKSPHAKLPYIVIVIDELADLMLSGNRDAVEHSITRLCQKARAAGIHLVIATQRPSTDVITGLIKANIPSRISFKVPSGIDSRTVLDASGSEDLIGRGDMLIIQPANPLRRLHGCFVGEEEIKRIVKFVKGPNSGEHYIQFPDYPEPQKKKRKF